MDEKIVKSDEQWRRELTEEEYYITRNRGTERPFTGGYCDNKERGVYRCICCGNELFHADTKYDSGSGWPSFWQPLVQENIVEKIDTSLLMTRIEVRSKFGDSHLGHLFDDGPDTSGLRYCINSASLRFVPKNELKAQGLDEFYHLFE